VYGLQCAERLAYDLALRGVTVVSGLARGIDAAAHRGALKTSGRTIAVLGGGLSRIYPPEHQGLADQIVRQGALISEYPMEAAPLPHHFPRRNRLISGLSLGVVVVEASQRSGALITADCALEQGREVFAVPGPMTAVTSQGTHQLLKQGARLVTSVEDILEELRLIPLSAGPPAAGGVAMQPLADPSADEAQAEPLDSALLRSGRIPSAVEGESTRLPPPERRVFACVDAHEPRYIDAIVDDSGLSLPEVSSALLHLELKQVIRQLPGKQFIRR
jgi:DNA processing protein